ncbi:uncharacterized protein LOC132735450 [Ruditapes philippinarum]|uniref:uncharacterized protein LOC132735450 n=1 Tax=Ruditapes philippinarum TaxID=129788 RepID=UPI00295A767F|nr:uncharacterized protein LOC132735450 [Ruditapes philippinarum]
MGLRLKSLFLFLVTYVTYITCKDCTVNDECSCTMDDGSGKVDLTSLGKSDNTPMFKDVLYSDEGYYYSYNPCGGFDEGACSNAAVCVLKQDKSHQQQIGDASRAAFKWDDDSGNVIAAYTSGTGILRLSTVNLVCDQTACTPTFQPEGEQGAGQFEMTLTTICACPGKCGPSGPINSTCNSVSGGLSSRSNINIIIMFLVLMLTTTTNNIMTLTCM